MPYFAQPIKALLSEPVEPIYAYRLFKDILKCEVEGSESQFAFKIGKGHEAIVIVTGFSLSDFKIANALMYMAYNKIADVSRSIPTFSTTQLEKWSIYIVPYANPWPFKSAELIRDNEALQAIDENGILIRYDALALKSRYSRFIHELITRIKPRLIIAVTTGAKYSATTIHNLKIHGIEGIESVQANPSDFLYHFSFEGYPSIALTIPRDYCLFEIALRISRFIRSFKAEWKELGKRVEVAVKAHRGKDEFIRTMELHGVIAEDYGGYVLLKAEGLRQYLLQAVIDEGFIEHVFDVEIQEVRLI